MSAAAACRLSDLIERLDRALLTLEEVDFDDVEGERTLSLHDCVRVWRTLGDAAVFLNEIRFRNRGDAMSDSPTFIATFDDGEVTRMTIYHASGRKTIDLKIALSRAAYASRKPGHAPIPAIVEAHFEERLEDSDVVLEKYDSKQLAEAAS
jgi:hypothetical protein